MMIFKRSYDEKLAQASYLVGSSSARQALVIDPNRDVEQYIRAAEQEGLEVTHVAETHIHADFVSGARELASRTGAQLYLSGEGDESWKYTFAEEAILLRDGDTFRVGEVEIRTLHTPGHTPEHLSFLVTDTAIADSPMGVFTGDFIFVNDVGRPDLLERAAAMSGTMEAGARSLFRSIRRFVAELPEHVQIWPGHGAGSACGKSLGAVPQSTLGYEMRVNWGLTIEDEESFVRAVLEGQPEPPSYFAEMKRINKEGRGTLAGFHLPRRLSESRLAELLRDAALVVDTRHLSDFAARHVAGTINIPLNRSFTTWAGWLIPYDRDFYLILDDRCTHCVEEAARDLAMIGLDRLAGYFGLSAIDSAGGPGQAVESIPQLTSDELVERLRNGSVQVLDVRGRTEWEAGHIPGVEPDGTGAGLHIPLGELPDRLDELSRDRTVVVHCQGGRRSAIAASILQANGFHDVANLPGGFADWEASGNPVQRERTPATAGAEG